MPTYSAPRWRGRMVWVTSFVVHAWFVTVVFLALGFRPQTSLVEPVVDTEVTLKEQPIELSLYDAPRISLPPAANPVQPPPQRSVSTNASPGENRVTPLAMTKSGGVAPPVTPQPTVRRMLHRPAHPGQSVVYVLDRSASMGEQGRFETARNYLIETLQMTPPGVSVQIVVYNRIADVLPLGGSSELTIMTPERHREAVTQLCAMYPEGTSSHAIGLKKALQAEPDAIFLLTDADELTDADVRQIASWNRGKSSIHTVRFAIPGSQMKAHSPLMRLARENRGSAQLIAVQEIR